MRVLVLKANYFPVCGASRLLETYLPHLDRERVEPVLVEVATEGRPSSIHFASPHLAHLRHESIPWRGASRARPAVAALRGLLRDLRIDAVNSHDMRCDLLCRLAGGGRGLGVPWVAHVHGWVGADGGWKLHLFERLDRWCVRAADEVWVGSRKAEADVRRGLPPGVPLRRLTNAVDPRSVAGAEAGAAAARTALSLPRDAFLVGMHARMHRPKGHHLLAEAVLRCKTPAVHALLLGYGDELGSLRRTAASDRAAGRIHVPGPQAPEATLAAVAGLDLYVYPSIRESLPLAVLEALLLGRPVVAARAGDLADVLEDGRAGLLVPPGDVDALAAAIDALAADRARAATLAARGRTRARERFAPQRLAREMEDSWLDVGRRRTG